MEFGGGVLQGGLRKVYGYMELQKGETSRTPLGYKTRAPERCSMGEETTDTVWREKGSRQRSTFQMAAPRMMLRTNHFVSNFKLGSVPSKVLLVKGVQKDITSATNRAVIASGHISSATTQTEKMVRVTVFHPIQHRLQH